MAELYNQLGHKFIHSGVLDMYKITIRSIGMLMALSSAFAVSAAAGNVQDTFFQNLQGLCGHSYVGTVVDGNESDDKWRQAKIVIHAPACAVATGNEIRIPLHVGEDKSRTWIISKTDSGLRLKHDHRHKDGTPDAVSIYGGDTAEEGSAVKQSFPVDDFSKALFVENGLNASVTNTWIMQLVKGKRLSYRLSRPGRSFQVDFDLSTPIQ